MSSLYMARLKEEIEKVDVNLKYLSYCEVMSYCS
jgi:hypothetical protein